MKMKDGAAFFADARWKRGPQAATVRHALALPFVVRGPLLDVGGGDGTFALLARDRYGIAAEVADISPIAVRVATERGITARICDVTEKLPFTEGDFGTVCALDVLEHLYDPLSLLREMRRVGHVVVIAVPNFNFIVGRLTMLFGRIPFQSKPQRGHVYWFNYPVLMRMICDAGMRVESISYGHALRLGFIGRFLARCFPNAFADSFVVRLVPLSDE